MPQEIRLKKKRPSIIGKSLRDLVLTLLAVVAALSAYVFYPKDQTPEYQSSYTYLETTGQLLSADTALDTPTYEKVAVTDVVDGDTIKARRADNSVISIRYIGIDTPEIKHQGNGTNDPYGPEAAALNSWLVKDKNVYLKADAAELDKYGRYLRYVYLENGVMVNYALIRLGYAKIMTIPPNVAFQQQFFAAQELARTEKRNLFKE